MANSDLRDVSLMAVTNHEMRTPLAAIRGFVDMLQRRRAELSDAEIDEFLQVISMQTDRLIRLADDLVTMDNLDDSSLTIEHEPIVLVPALEQIVRDLPGGDRVKLRISEGGPPTIESDALRLGQVLTNLLTNALKYSDEGSEVTVELYAEDDEDLGRLVVSHWPGAEAFAHIAVEIDDHSVTPKPVEKPVPPRGRRACSARSRPTSPGPSSDCRTA